ncbi:MAG: thiamine pyrophosphate-binding protein, partial [Xanthobacteraceae bacterium]|nr:thiamine pyrophosphate-binding protein [Xanthobacteraceae bacterium]
MTQGADFILSALVEEGLDHLFMVPGGLVDPMLPALARAPRLRPIVAAQEGGAAYMADGYARAAGRFGAALGIGGPGLCNMVTAVAAAKTDASPVLVLSGEVPVELEGIGAFQDASQATLDDTAVMKPVTRLSTTVTDAKTLDHWLRHALTAMWREPSGPVHLSLTQDALLGQTAARHRSVAEYFPVMKPLSRDAALAALDQLADKRARRIRIAFLVGAGVEHDQAAARLRAVAERWSIPVATTLRAKGVLPEDHPLSLGVFGYAGTRHATSAILDEALDVLLVLGSGLNERDSMHWTLSQRSRAMLLQVNTNMDALAMHGSPGNVVLGSSHAFLDLMVERADHIGQVLDAGREQRRAWMEKIRSGPRLYDVENCASGDVPIHPAAAIATLRRMYPRDGIVLVDSGAHRAFVGHYWSAYAPRTYISATNLGPMGWAIAAAVGVQCAQPDRRVAVFTGDGCMQMHGIEIQTAARYRLPIIFVVLNNGALGNVWLRAHTEGPVPAELTSIPDHDWAGFGRSLGAQGFTVRAPAELEDTYRRALTANATVVI